jgi:hypothetical protein
MPAHLCPQDLPVLAYRTLPLLALALLLPTASSAATPAGVDETKLLSEEDARTLGVESAYDRPRPDVEANVHAAATLQFIAPIGSATSIASVTLQGDAVLRRGPWGVSLTPRLRIDDFTDPLAQSTAFIQQAYAFYRIPTGEIKVGKVLAQLGRLWDFGLFGPVLANNDYKIMPDIGASVEGEMTGVSGRQLGYALQYFAVDGKTFSVANPSLLSVARARRLHNVTARIVPNAQLGEFKVAWGLSGQTYIARRAARHRVWRGATDGYVGWRNLEGFVELSLQGEGDVASADNAPLSAFNSLWGGIQATFGPVKGRFHVNAVRYAPPNPGWDILYQPGLEYEVHKQLSFVTEGAVLRSSLKQVQRSDQSLFLFVLLKA